MITTPPADLDGILAKVQKLLNTTGRSPEEAAAYVEKAHALLAQYDLSIDDIGKLTADPRTAVAEREGVTGVTEGKPEGWKADLLFSVARAFECKVLNVQHTEQTKSGKYRVVTTYSLVGFGHDLEAAHYAHSFLLAEVARLGKEYARVGWDAIKEESRRRGISVHDAERWYTQWTGTHPLKAELYFIKGATQTVTEALDREAARRRREAVEVNPNALMVQKGAEVDDYLGRKSYGDRWEDVKARQAKWAAEAREESEKRSQLRRAHMADEHDAGRVAECPICRIEANAEEEAKRRPETDAQRQAREEREWRRSERNYQRYVREQAKIDHDALGAGQAAGRKINIRPGVGSGTSGKEQLG
jgi:hypothetical protein